MASRKISSLDDLMGGALKARFEYELDRVLKNVFDPNTAAEVKRSVTIKIDIKPNERRDSAEFRVDVNSKIAPPLSVKQTVLLERDDSGNVRAKEITGQVPGQVGMDGKAVLPKVINFGPALEDQEAQEE